MGIKRRLQFIAGYFSHSRDFELRFGDVLKGVLRRTCTRFALNKIESIFEGDEYMVVKLLDSSSVLEPLYWPKTLPLYSLYMVIAECLNKED